MINFWGFREEKNIVGDVVKSIFVLFFKVVVVCLIFNIIIFGGGKWIISFFMVMMLFCFYMYLYDSLNYFVFGIVCFGKLILLGERI